MIVDSSALLAVLCREPSPPPVEEEHCLETGGLELDFGLARKAVAGPDCFRAGQSPHGC